MTEIVGIINITPDSFSDGGACFDADFAIQAMAKMIEEGVDIIDIGAESTRPGAVPITQEEEWQRLEPVLKALPRFTGAPVRFSVDTRHAQTARQVLSMGVRWINDVSGFADSAMVDAVKHSECTLVMMHSLMVPADKTVVMAQADVVGALLQWAEERLAKLVQVGIDKSRIIFDPGIGFGKTAAQSWTILREIARFKALGVPLLVGHSRKSFLAAGEDADDATLYVSQHLAMHRVNFLRVHNVARHRQMLTITRQLNG